MAKWEGKVSTTLTKASANQVWPLFKDFFNLHKWYPNFPICYGIKGVNGEVGCVRYCSGFSIPNQDSGIDNISWTKERLVAIDSNQMSLSYDLVDCNIGFKSYLATLKVVPSGGAKGCKIEWSFSVDPVEGLTYEFLYEKVYQDGLDQTAKKMEDALVQQGLIKSEN